MMHFFGSEIVLAADSSGDSWSYIGLAFFLSGFIFYWLMFLRYRNADKRFKHESQTRSEIRNVQVRDDFIRSQRGLRNSTMQGANHRQVSGSLNALSKLSGLGGQSVQQMFDQVNRFTRND